jgi:hypothetical protein
VRACSKRAVEIRGDIPEAGAGIPESVRGAGVARVPVKRSDWNSNKYKEFLWRQESEGLERGVHEEETLAHSERRSSRVFERGGRGLLRDLCRSFPPASEREARMDDPTPRSKKDRETECAFGALVPKQGPLSSLTP